MNILIILAHPSGSSFNHALAETVRETLDVHGHQVVWHDLYAEGFNPVLPAEELSREAPRDLLLERYRQELQAAEGLVFIHPNWWGQPPAILKGWIDRIFRANVAYRFLPGDKGEGVPEGLLKAKSALILNTSDTSAEREARVFHDPLAAIWQNCILKFCGVERVEREVFRVMATSTLEQRESWLAAARRRAREIFVTADA